jgi:hypothetical protein
MPQPQLSPCELTPLARLTLEVVMRMLLKAVIDPETGGEVFRSGGVADALDQLQEILQPEAFYAYGEDGQRAFLAVFDLADSSQIPVVGEPLYQLTKGKITMIPCMNLEDVKKGAEEAARRMSAMQSQPGGGSQM